MIGLTARRAALGLMFAAAPFSQAFADPATELQPLDIVTTADRVPESLSRTGSAITVVPRSEIEKFGSQNVADVLRDVPGVDVVNTGGPGQATSVSLRGAGDERTLVLVDGVPIGDPIGNGGQGAFDWGSFTAADIERIEVLRGPQSALYGSDAMGGVINIITRKGTKTPHGSVSVEGGSYGTVDTRASLSGGDDRWTYSVAADFLHTDGFPRVGYRINSPIVIGDGVTPLPALPSGDPTDLGGVAGRFSYKLSDAVTIDALLEAQGNSNRFDNPFAFVPSDVFSTFNHQNTYRLNGYVKATVDPWNGLWTNQLTVFGNLTDTDIAETEGCYNAFYTAFDCHSGYRGGRYGAEYQSNANLGPWGGLTVGARTMTETAQTSESPNPNDGSFMPVSKQQTTDSVYGEYRYTAFNHLDMTLGGRVDSVEDGPTFETWRATAAYRFDTGTKLRASAGTGAKVPTLYERYSPYGTAGLQPETSTAFDVGVDQKIFGDRATLSATYFYSEYSNLINFAATSGCTAAQLATGGGCFYNIGKARMQGLELAADATLVPDTLRMKASYTYTDARNLDPLATDSNGGGQQLERVPFNKGSLSLIWTPTPKWEIEPRLTIVDNRFDYDWITYGRTSLAGYAKLDVYAKYKITDNLTAFARGENLTNAYYVEAFDYSTPGPSFYAGLKYSW